MDFAPTCVAIVPLALTQDSEHKASAEPKLHTPAGFARMNGRRVGSSDGALVLVGRICCVPSTSETTETINIEVKTHSPPLSSSAPQRDVRWLKSLFTRDGVLPKFIDNNDNLPA